MARIARHTSDETKQSIQDAFIELYMEERLEKITIGALSTGAHVNRATFYRYYKDVYDLMDSIEQKFILKISAILPIIIHGLLHNDLLMKTETLQQFYKSNKDMLLLFFVKHPNMQIISSIKDHARTYAMKELNMDSTSLNTQQVLLIEYICNAQLGLITWWLQNGNQTELPLLVQTMMQANINGPLSTLKGMSKKVF